MSSTITFSATVSVNGPDSFTITNRVESNISDLHSELSKEIYSVKEEAIREGLIALGGRHRRRNNETIR